ncbi:hypothetical protein A5643_05245 [Mycobacterium sp. 1274756.6]|nr:hypothetical protein A5643_05245 [Mycobacterium sp. 1274756.6]
MRVAIITESFPPQRDPVSDSVLQLIDRLRDDDHEVLVVAPDNPRGQRRADRVHDGIRVHRVPVLRGRDGALHGLPRPRLLGVLRGFRPHVVHVASPGLLGYGGLRVARRLGVPTVAVCQPGPAGSHPGRVWLRHLHGCADRTLAPSAPALECLAAGGVPRVYFWPPNRPTVYAELIDHYRAVAAGPTR